MNIELDEHGILEFTSETDVYGQALWNRFSVLINQRFAKELKEKLEDYLEC